ncbi:DUF3304 domain-containing protein [Collimonas sp.]|jgi:hypothetical protein|uniref:DUF3304 domain-containing protein n=1 Tax=Collimonas sp. TaxID=1963772 RepID=UPI002BE318FA|nr:DUF3304 domain-containing protein [Collimonas sp.]HWW05022.1 DUF3304 domain-containing protein [Collimonas sp.]
MRLTHSKARFSWLHTLAMSILAFIFTGCASVHAGGDEDNFTPVGLTGVQHIGRDFNISDFYVDGAGGGNVGREGGGGGTVCCVALPKKWRQGLTAEVRWAVGDWSKENLTETAIGNYKSVTSEGIYKANVPIEKYEEPEHVWVHFFAGGKIRIVSSSPGSLSKLHPIQRNDPHAVDSATVGTRIAALFTPEELEEMSRKRDANRKKYGDWR